MAQHLIVPVDGSPTSLAAVDVASILVRRAGGSVRVVQIVPDGDDVRVAQADLEEQLAGLDTSDVSIESEVRHSDNTVAEEIDAMVAAHPGAVVVLASHGRGRSVAIIGSVAEDISSHVVGPIVFVGPNCAVTDLSGPVVVSVDGSEESERALPFAVESADQLGVVPMIVYVAEPDSAPPPESGLHESVYPARLATDLTAQTGHSVQYDVLHDPNPARAVADFANRQGASLIVAASHGRTGLRRLTMGSVVAGFVRHASAPVLIVRLALPD